MRITLDTNVIISAVVFDSEVMNEVVYKVVFDHTLVLSTYIIEELKRVTKMKFPDKMNAINDLLTEVPFELCYTPEDIDEGLFDIRDKKDYPVLYCAITDNVDVLITGDKDCAATDIEKPEILTPAQFLEKYY
jgi:putative PIN family toxin of toxin-antitoxin system